jgi:hypothetical protein
MASLAAASGVQMLFFLATAVGQSSSGYRYVGESLAYSTMSGKWLVWQQKLVCQGDGWFSISKWSVKRMDSKQQKLVCRWYGNHSSS